VEVSPDTAVPLDYRYLVEKFLGLVVEQFLGLVPSAGVTAGRRRATEADGVYLVDYHYLVEKFLGLVPSAGITAGRRRATEADGVYLVDSSRHYVIVVFADKPTDVARFCLLVAAQAHCSLHFRLDTTPSIVVIRSSMTRVCRM